MVREIFADTRNCPLSSEPWSGEGSLTTGRGQAEGSAGQAGEAGQGARRVRRVKLVRRISEVSAEMDSPTQ